jgi:hypothetical protein
MFETHFHLTTFQIKTQLYSKWPLAAIIDVPKFTFTCITTSDKFLKISNWSLVTILEVQNSAQNARSSTHNMMDAKIHLQSFIVSDAVSKHPVW